MNSRKNRKKGFTLAELLASVVVVLLLTLLLTTMIGLGSKVYVQTAKDSEAQMLASSLTTMVEDELRYATNIENRTISGEVRATYFSQSLKLGKDCYIDEDENGRIYVYYGEDFKYPLATDKSYVYGLTADIDVDYDADVNQFDVEINIKDETEIICTSSFSVLPLGSSN